MQVNAQRILLSYAGLLAALGVALAAVDGFHSGWRIVGMNIAIGCAFMAVLCHLGSTHRITFVRRLGKSGGIILTFAAAINFGRLAFKWHRSELDMPIDAAIAALMSIGGFVCTVLLWRTMRDSIVDRWALRVRQLAAVTGMAAMAGGLAMIKFASTPQAATAVSQSTTAVNDVMIGAADAAIGERIIDNALKNKAVVDALEQRGVRAEQVRQLAQQPELRAAALAALHGEPVESSVNPRVDPEAEPNLHEQPAASVARTTLDQLSTAELRQLAGRYNIDPSRLDEHALRSLDPAQLERRFNDPRATEALSTLHSNEIDSSIAHYAATRRSDTSTEATRPAERMHSRIDDRAGSARLSTRAAADPRVTNTIDQQVTNASASSTDDRADTSIVPAEMYARRSLLDRADPAQQLALTGRVEPTFEIDLTNATVDVPSAQQSSADRRDSAAAPQPATTSDAKALAEVIRAEVLEPARSATMPMPEMQSWLEDPGLFLTRTGTIAAAIGAAVLLCAIAAGQRTSPQPAV